MRGQRNKQAESENGAGVPTDKQIEIIDVSEHRLRRPSSKKWRELIKKVWEADPLICSKCSREMRIVALIDEREVIERILRHLGLWEEGVRLKSARAPPDGEGIVELFAADPFPDYPVTTLSLGTGLTWQHGAGHGLRCLRERISVRGRGGIFKTGKLCRSRNRTWPSGACPGRPDRPP